ncbi:hypothetical protein [Ilumatobacter sp.]|uniref:hypothetical protein n=1 Tax=Ilumatobacter sp. TaxID=1967498 RepID=UPI003B51D908
MAGAPISDRGAATEAGATDDPADPVDPADGVSDATSDATSDAATLAELRRTRRERRLGDTEWFDVLYRVYLFALVGSVAVVYASDAIAGVLDDELATADVVGRGPTIAGVVAAVALATGLRSGADGGPISIEAADIDHLLLSPLDRRRVMARPLVQRMRSISFALGLAIAVVAQFVAREIAGSRAAWAASGALFGAVLGAMFVGSAVVAHALRLPRAAATASGGVVVAWQAAVAWRTWTGDARGIEGAGPTDLVGSVLFWGIRQRALDVVALGAIVAVVGVALALAGRLRLEPLERRGQLVSQLRFAATVQDIRTVVALRRQLSAESVRRRPWFGIGLADGARRAGGASPPHRTRSADARPRAVRRTRTSTSAVAPAVVWRRGATSIARLPLGRLVRIGAIAAIGGAAASLAVSESALLAVVVVGAAFLVGLEAAEPLAQEVDRPDLAEALPIDRGWLFAHHLVAPAALVALAGLVGAVAAAAVHPSHAAGAFALAIPVAWTGAIGSVVTTVRDAPEPLAVSSTNLMGAERGAETSLAPPEFAGMSNAVTGAVPIVLSATAALPVLTMRLDASSSTIVRSWIGAALALAMLVWWIVRRDRWAVSVRRFFAAGRAEAAGSAP